MKRILITGTTGFLGGLVARQLSRNPNIQLILACRQCQRLPSSIKGEIRAGDLASLEYRKSLVQNVDAIAHTASWASLWRAKKQERTHFFEPTLSLIEESIKAGVKRFVLTGTVAMNRKSPPGTVYGDDDPAVETGYWPHLDYLIRIDRYMRENRGRGMGMVTLRLGHFIGPGNSLGLVPALVPRLGTGLVPHLDGGRRKLPLVGPEDMAHAFERSLLAEDLESYESLNIVGKDFPSLRNVIDQIHAITGFPAPWISVPYPLAYFFGMLLESLHPPLPGSPFLTRSIVHLAEGWEASGKKAREKLGYKPEGNWKEILKDHLFELKQRGYPWPPLRSKT